MQSLTGYDRWLTTPPDEGPAICDYCQLEQSDPDEMEQVGNTKKYACSTCYEKHTCYVCEDAAQEDFSRDGKAYCEVCYHEIYACPTCKEQFEYCKCGEKP